ncbi:MAG: LamG domain-containing protein [Deltaproteobacteria bacterium]|nr:LamG domain-containing protein [Deltaproteobacteria bacterium]
MGIARTGVAGLYLSWLSVTACSFSRTDGIRPDEGADARVDLEDAPLQTTADAPEPPDAPPQQVTCTTSDAALKLCLEFEDVSLAETALDGSAGAHHATLSGVTPGMRDVPGSSHAATLATTSSIVLGDTPDFDVQAVSLGAWVRRTATPSSGQRFGVIDIGRRNAGMAIDAGGNVVCFVKDAQTLWVRPGGGTALNEWAFAACTYSAPMLCAYSFRNGSATPQVTCGNTDGAPLDTSDGVGAIGALLDLTSGALTQRFVGSIDAVRVYNRALTQAQLCASAGLSGC